MALDHDVKDPGPDLILGHDRLSLTFRALYLVRLSLTLDVSNLDYSRAQLLRRLLRRSWLSRFIALHALCKLFVSTNEDDIST